jgi:flavin reductase (DIM6/NTAB) family NADH-FMN oxidoreductase RutF
MDQAAKKTVLRMFTYGLHAISVREGDRVNAFTANWITQVAFDPPMVALAVENSGASIEPLRASGRFAVSVFGTGQRELAGHFGRPSARIPDKLAGTAWHPSPVGLPILDEALGWLECSVRGSLPAGDHTVFVAEVVEAGVLREDQPLSMAETGFRYYG